MMTTTKILLELILLHQRTNMLLNATILVYGRQPRYNILRERSGPIRFGNREIDTPGSSFLIYFRKPFLKIILKWTNKEEMIVFGKNWEGCLRIEEEF